MSEDERKVDATMERYADGDNAVTEYDCRAIAPTCIQPAHDFFLEELANPQEARERSGTLDRLIYRISYV